MTDLNLNDDSTKEQWEGVSMSYATPRFILKQHVLKFDFQLVNEIWRKTAFINLIFHKKSINIQIVANTESESAGSSETMKRNDE